MRAAVLQVAPKLCLTKDDLVRAVDRMVGDVCEEHHPDLIVFPECMGLWMCLMEPVTALGKIWSWFLPRHAVQANRIRTTIDEPWDPARAYETMFGIQLSRPPRFAKRERAAFSGGPGWLLRDVPDYDILLPGIRRSRAAGVLARAAEWLFDRIPLRFLAKKMRSDEQFGVYVEAFSAAARKHVVTIQAGSIFSLTDHGVRNVAYVFGPLGTIIAHQEKVHPIPFETMLGIVAGEPQPIDEILFHVGHTRPVIEVERLRKPRLR